MIGLELAGLSGVAGQFVDLVVEVVIAFAGVRLILERTISLIKGDD